MNVVSREAQREVLSGRLHAREAGVAPARLHAFRVVALELELRPECAVGEEANYVLTSGVTEDSRNRLEESRTYSWSTARRTRLALAFGIR